MLMAIAAFLISHVATDGSMLALGLMAAAAIILDFGVTTSLVCGQRAIFGLSPENRSRLNGLFMAFFFAGGAVGSALGGWAYATGGWERTSWVGLAFPTLALLALLTEFRPGRAARKS
jgi:predicted MFS family arabinose efflux permease